MKRPKLNKIPLNLALHMMTQSRSISITMSVGQWDALLEASYHANWLLIEMNKNGNPVAAYQKSCVRSH